MLTLLLNWRTWAALGLVVTHWFAYHQGGLSKQVEFDRYVAEQQTAHIAALEDARAKEQTIQLAKQKAENDYQALKKKSADSALSAESERVLLLSALDAARSTPTNPTTGSGIDADPTQGILRESIGRYAEVAGIADRLSDQVTGLQDYVKGVCVR
jgi:hypothetical protein